MDWQQVGSITLAWVPWGLAVAGGYWGFSEHRRAVKNEKRNAEAYDASPWGDAEYVSGDLFKVRNVTTRDVVALDINADPEEKATLLGVRNVFPITIYAGDELDFTSSARLSLDRPNVIIEWRYSDSDQLRKNRRILPGVSQ